MDAKFSISISTNKLENLLGDDRKKTKKGRLRELQAAIDSLHASEKLLEEVDILDEASVNDEPTAQLLEAVYSAEVAIDTFLERKKPLQEEKNKDDERKRRYTFSKEMGFFCCTSCCVPFNVINFIDVVRYYSRRIFFTRVKYLYREIRLAQKMRELNDAFRRLVETKGANSGTQNSDYYTGSMSFQNGREQDSQKQLVDLQQQTNELVARLIHQVNCKDGLSAGNEIQVVNHSQNRNDRNQSSQVIAVVGDGGSGKTTLVRRAYNRVDVKRHFRHRAWVRIHGGFRARDVLAGILEQINQAELVPVTIHSEEALIPRLTQVLNGTKFLIVVEDVDILPVIWKYIRRVLPLSSHDGKIIVTAKNSNNLSPYVSCSTFELRQLNGEESWKLFSQKVGIAEEELNNSKLIEHRERILKICGGLPSAIVLLGGLLSTRDQSYEEWSRVITLANETNGGILALSFKDLPSIVKPCFLYMAIFPKGFEIPVRRLIHLWSAEGFVTPSDHEQDLAEMCLEELITRNMIEVTWRLDGTLKTCSMAGVVYDFFSSKANNFGFLCHQHSWPSHSSPEGQRKFAVRRLAAYMDINYFPSSLCCVHNLRSYVAFDTRVQIMPSRDTDMLLNKIISGRGFGLLKILDLEGVNQPKFSNDVVGKLLHLSYLGLRSTFIDNLPNGVEYLSCLETLDVNHTNVCVVSLKKAEKLQHIYLNDGSFTFDLIPTNLRTLWGLYSAYNIPFGILLDEIRKLAKLGVTLREGIHDFERVACWINQQTELKSLKLRSIKKDGRSSSIKLLSMAEQYKLQELYLLGKLPDSVIDVSFLPPNLRKLTLSLSELEEDPMPVLGRLPHLNILRLFANSYKGTSITCVSEGFPKLQLLKLWNLPVKEWIVQEGAMHCLKELEIRCCDDLEMPQGLQNVTTLKELVLTNMPTDFRAAAEDSLHGRDVYIINNSWNSDPFEFLS